MTASFAQPSDVDRLPVQDTSLPFSSPSLSDGHSSFKSESIRSTAYSTGPAPFASPLLNRDGDFGADSPADSITLDKARQLYDDCWKILEENIPPEDWKWTTGLSISNSWVVRHWVKELDFADWSIMDVSTTSFSSRVDIKKKPTP